MKKRNINRLVKTKVVDGSGKRHECSGEAAIVVVSRNTGKRENPVDTKTVIYGDKASLQELVKSLWESKDFQVLLNTYINKQEDGSIK